MFWFFWLALSFWSLLLRMTQNKTQCKIHHWDWFSQQFITLKFCNNFSSEKLFTHEIFVFEKLSNVMIVQSILEIRVLIFFWITFVWMKKCLQISKKKQVASSRSFALFRIWLSIDKTSPPAIIPCSIIIKL